MHCTNLEHGTLAIAKFVRPNLTEFCSNVSFQHISYGKALKYKMRDYWLAYMTGDIEGLHGLPEEVRGNHNTATNL